MKKIWIVLLSVYVTLVTVGCVVFGVLYFGQKFGWGTDGFGRTKAECIEAVDATYKVMNFDASASAAAFTDEDWEKKEGTEAKEQVAVFRRLIALTKGILENETYSLTNKVISFHVDDFLGAKKINFKMHFDVDGDKLFVTYYMANGDFDTTDFQYYDITINYDYQNHKVRTYNSNFFGAGDVKSCKYAAEEGTFVLKSNAGEIENFKTELEAEAKQFNKKTFENTDYDFSKEFKDAQKDLLGN